ncbi:AIF_collapsed_G0019850.mRNA.1.CDS.1 [Saccharomyces cerevisiae]|nr:AIF_HP2_G0022000.mRNA.1.CDS.1 [Saccharomyces cerevisiae]CAI6521280.1 AIF_HP1_G0019480.mRNA.1.CDS.1 [Saccharomyces cerevisiae]CAI6533790.1 AIF_HP2_G0022000.mRNA.1.CDS.1 [Saccharomyces cerevisiae]CAI6673338.1 AIF_collapsed_G0019850.mRNA.1.CDS.1 [Saccharomyces cerevisiae]
MPYAHGCYKYILLSNLPYSHTPIHGPFSLNQYQMHPHHYARHLPQRSIPCAIYP